MTCKDCLCSDVCIETRDQIQMLAYQSRNDVEKVCSNFKDKSRFAEICRCKDCLYFEYKVGSYGICEHWHTNSQDIFDLNYCGYAEPRTLKERGEEK